MKRIAISLLGSMALTLGLPVILALLFYPGDQNAIGGLLLYWPLSLIEKLGIGPDCANANLIAEKLSCIKIAILIDLMGYPLIICGCGYIIHRILFRPQKTMRLPQVG